MLSFRVISEKESFKREWNREDRFAYSERFEQSCFCVSKSEYLSSFGWLYLPQKYPKRSSDDA